MKIYKKLIIIFITLLLFVTFPSCSTDNDLKEDFIDYYKTQLNSNANFIIGNLEKESDSNNPKVILTLFLDDDTETNEQTYEWLQVSPNERKKDLKEYGDIVIKYANENNWSNNYYLYINVSNIYDGCSILYDYENDEIWIPNCENIFLEMYQKFGTFYKKELENTQEGINFLVENNLAYVKHDKVEYNNNMSYTAFIQNGEFKTYGENNSTKY